MTKFNRVDTNYLADWRKNYREIFNEFSAGRVALLDAIDVLRHLGFKDEALKIEVLELQKAKREAQGPALKLVSN